MSTSMSLFCLVFGEKDEQPFSVRVNGGNTVDKLKKLIKEVKPNRLKDIHAHHLQLWKWNQPGDADRVEAVGLDSSNMLNPMIKMTRVFGDDFPKEEFIHIIIKIPMLGK